MIFYSPNKKNSILERYGCTAIVSLNKYPIFNKKALIEDRAMFIYAPSEPILYVDAVVSHLYIMYKELTGADTHQFVLLTKFNIEKYDAVHMWCNSGGIFLPAVEQTLEKDLERLEKKIKIYTSLELEYMRKK